MYILPDTNIRILKPIPQLDYYDSQTTYLPKNMTTLEVWNATMSEPQPLLKTAFKIRDVISSIFKVKRIGGFSGLQVKSIRIGQYLDFFLVEYVDDECLVLTERDSHLDVMTCISVSGEVLSVTSSVSVHNMFGKAYMIPVGIAHPWIVSGMLKRLKSLA